MLVIAIWSSSIPDALRTYRLHGHDGSTTSWRRPGATYRGPPACDPFARPGFLSFDPAHAYDAAWVPFDPSCPPAPDYLGALRVLRDVSKDEDANMRQQLIRAPARKDAGRPTGDVGQGREVADAWGRPYPDLSFLKGKLALMLGDSVDRNVLEHLCELLNARVRGFGYQNVTGPIPAGWDPRGTPWMLNLGLVASEWEGVWDGGGWMEGMMQGNSEGGEFAGLDFGLVNSFLYGMDDRDEFAAQSDWHPPGLAEERIATLVVPMLTQLADLSSPDFPHGPPAYWDNSHYTVPARAESAEPSKSMPGRHQKTRPRTFHLDDFLAHGHQLRGADAPALICLGGGLWDLAYWGRRDRAAGRAVSEPLTAQQLDWWQGRMLSVIRLLKAIFPDTPIWFRTLHRVGENFWASHDWGVGVKMGHGFVNFFGDARVHQVREMEMHVARLEGLPIFDFGHIWEGFQKYQDKVHPNRDPGGTIMGQAVLHQLYLESIGRENWDADARRNVGLLPHGRTV